MEPDKDKFNPYVGPQPFESKDRELFFGRSRETEEIVSLIFGHPVVLVYAESGAGKTSLFNAQVIPTLEQYDLQVLPVARVKGKPPEDVNLEDIVNLYMFNVLRSISPESKGQELLSESLSTFLDSYPHKVNRRQKRVLRILIIDQFEEIFTIYIKEWREQQKTFFQQLSDAVTADPMLRVVLVMREDYIAQLDPFSQYLPERLRPRFRLVRLDREAAKLAVAGPLKNTKRYYAEGVAEDLVEELLKIQVETDSQRSDKITGEYVEPVQLQVVCEGLWQKLPPEVTEITRDYVGDVDNALADFYVKAIRKATSETGIEEASIRDWCETKLITSSGTRSIVHREAQTTGGIPNSVVEILEKSRLVKAEQRFGALWYELTHDRLISPIKESNKVWRYEREREKYEREREKYERERKKKSLIIKTIIPSIAVVIIGIVLALNYYGYFTVRNSTEVFSVPIGQSPFNPSVNPNTNLVYVPDIDTNMVFVLDGTTNKLLPKAVPVGQKPSAVSVNPNTNLVYVANYGDNTVSVIDGSINNKDIFANIQGFLGRLIYGSNYNKDNIISNIVLTTASVGKNPTSISINPNTNLVYVANRGDNTVFVIDGKTNKVAATVPVGQKPSAVSVNPNTNLVYVANPGDNTVFVIDGKTNKVIRTLAVDETPISVSVNPNTNLVYVANYDGNTVSVIDGTRNSVARTLPAGNGPISISVNPNTNIAYVADQASSTISVIDGKTNTIVRTLVVGNGPEGLSINPNTNMIYTSDKNDNSVIAMNALTMGTSKVRKLDNSPNGVSINPITNRIYVSNNDSNTVSIMDGKTNKLLPRPMTVGNGSNYLSVNPNTNLVYVANPGDNTVSVIDGKTNKVAATVTVGQNPSAVSVNPNTNLVYVANYGDNTVSVIDGKTNKVAATVTVGQNPSAVSVNPNTNLVYVANSGDNTVSVINGTRNKLIANVTVDRRPIDISVNPNTNLVYVSNSDSRSVSVIDGKTNTIVSTLSVGNGPCGISVNPNTNLVYVANSGDNTVSVINGTRNSVARTLPAGNGPSGIAINPNTNLVYVDYSFSNTVSVINGTRIQQQSIQLNQ